MKKTIKLEDIEPIELYGAGNKILEEFCSYFPGLKVTARGTDIILDGNPSQIEEFGMKLYELIRLCHIKKSLTIYDVEDIFDGENSPEKFLLNGDAVIVHSTDGRAIRARNANQQKMVKAYFENDLIFAIGPAGTGKTYVAIALAVRALKNREIKRIIPAPPWKRANAWASSPETSRINLTRTCSLCTTPLAIWSLPANSRSLWPTAPSR